MSDSDSSVVESELALESVDLDALFTTFYRLNHWGSCETRSGPGSERARMKQVVDDLGRLVRDNCIQSMLDAPCGDFNWMQDVSLQGIDYIGCDIVDELIEANTDRYGGHGRTFRRLDFTVDPVPRVDLVLCRDALVHFSYTHVFAALRNFRASGSRYLLTTSFTDTEENSNIPTGEWQPINLQRSPFLLPPPIVTLRDDTEEHHDDKVLALWDLREPEIFENFPARDQERGDR